MEQFDGKLIVITAPSGAGKTTIVRHLLSKYTDLGFSISATTRAQRESEENGKDYYFLDIDQFKEKISDNAFIEWEEVYKDQYYGTLYDEVERLWSERKHIVFDIDVNGAENIKEKYGDKCKAIFIKAPSFAILVKRLKERRTENKDSLRKRVNRIKKELTYETKFDDIIVNDVLDVALKEAEIIVETFTGIKENE